MSAILADLNTGDMVLTNRQLTLTDGPRQFAQRVNSRLRFILGEWFLDVTDGTDWRGSILIKNPINAQSILKARIAGTPNFVSLLSFSFNVDKNRKATVTYSGMCASGPYQGTTEFVFPMGAAQTFIFQT